MRKISIRAVLFAIAFAAVWMLATPTASFAQIGVSVRFGPPALPIYEQPVCPGDGYLWTPGYWAWADDDYYWVPGTWVEAPEVGFLWTPPYWGWGDGGFLFHAGYWGPHIGFYGGINYGFGYFGVGFDGGRWDGGHFFYNRAAANINVTNIHNVYNTTIVHETTVNRVSYNGGEGGVTARPTTEQEAAEHDRHIAPVAAQTQHIEEARNNKELRASANQGKPPIAATAKPGDFREGAQASKEAGAPYKAPAERTGSEVRSGGEEHPAEPRTENARPATPNHPNDLPAMERPAAPNTGNANLDKKYQQQQQKLGQKQDQERQKLQQQQDKEHAQMAKQNANDARKQQVEQKHQQQTQQLQQRHTQQQQNLQQRQAPRPAAKPKG